LSDLVNISLKTTGGEKNCFVISEPEALLKEMLVYIIKTEIAT